MLKRLPERLDAAAIPTLLSELGLLNPNITYPAEVTTERIQASGIRYSEEHLDLALATKAPTLSIADRIAVKLAMQQHGLFGRQRA